jgi:hypothetical protein
MKILSIVETAYRATLEEQDDTILWLNHALKNHGADMSLLLRGNAASYLVRGQDASGLSFGERGLAHPPEPDKDLERLIAAKVPVYAVEEDVRERGLPQERMISGVERLGCKDLPELLDRFDQVWHW